ncbi:MAG: aceA [Microvirga sp.]|nr:aceA [Microvirga sp.]
MTSQTSPASTNDLIPSAPKGRFDGVRRPYSAEDVQRLRGSVQIAHTLAERGAQTLWQLLHERPYVVPMFIRSVP